MSFVLLGILNSQAAGAGGGIPAYEHISTTDITTATSSVTFSSLDTTAADYDHLEIRFAASSSFTLGSDMMLYLQVNADDSNSYTTHYMYADGSSSVRDQRQENSQQFRLRKAVSNTTDEDFKVGIISMLDFSSANKNTSIRSLYGGVGALEQLVISGGVYKKTNAVTSLNLSPEAGSFIAGSRFSLYGIRGA